MTEDIKRASSERKGDAENVCLESALESKRTREHDAVFGELTDEGPDYRSVGGPTVPKCFCKQLTLPLA